MQPQGRVGSGCCALTFHRPSCILRLLGKARGSHLPFGFPGRTSIFGESLLWKVLGPGCFGGAVGTPTAAAHCLHVSSLSQVSDKGLYSCRVNNTAGEAVRTFLLTVQGKLGTRLPASLRYP